MLNPPRTKRKERQPSTNEEDSSAEDTLSASDENAAGALPTPRDISDVQVVIASGDDASSSQSNSFTNVPAPTEAKPPNQSHPESPALKPPGRSASYTYVSREATIDGSMSNSSSKMSDSDSMIGVDLPITVIVALKTLRGSFALSSPTSVLRRSGLRASGRKMRNDESQREDYADEHHATAPTIAVPKREHFHRSSPDVSREASERVIRPNGKQRQHFISQRSSNYKTPPRPGRILGAPFDARPATRLPAPSTAGTRAKSPHPGRSRRNHRNERQSANPAISKALSSTDQWWAGPESSVTKIIGDLRRSLMRDPRRV